jgi:putative IMPACT (imprinted ancient) family translation regulator
MFNENQMSFDTSSWFCFNKDYVEYKDIINDRNSKYTVVWWKVNSKNEVVAFITNLKKNKFFEQATHNSFAYRIRLENWAILEWKNDDWETWAWMCILRELQRENATWFVLVVTRYFWGTKLQNDRYKNVIDSCKIFFDKEIK